MGLFHKCIGWRLTDPTFFLESCNDWLTVVFITFVVKLELLLSMEICVICYRG